MAYSFKGSISFGLVYIPITLYSSIKNNEIGFHMLDKKTMSRIQYQKTCADCNGKIVESQNIVKGFEYEKGKYVLFSDEDFEKLKTKQDKNIVIEQFVYEKEIDPIYYHHPYYVVPNGAEKAYALLIHAMQKENKVGIAKCVIGNKETLIALRAKSNMLLLNTLFFYDEIIKNPMDEINIKSSEKELKLAISLIESMSETFNPKNFHNDYKEKIKDAIQQKIAGKKIVKVKEKTIHPVVDLMDALQKSLQKKPKSKMKNSILKNDTKSNARKASA